MDIPPHPSSPVLRWPTRVSRLYPVLSLVLALTTSTFLYAWQAAQLELNNLASVDQRNKELHKQIEDLTASHTLDQAKLALQNQKITDATAQLDKVEKDLKAKTDDLAAKQSQLTQAEAQVKQQQDQLAKNSSELESLRGRPPLFSFQNQTSLADISTKEDAVKSVVNAAYDYIAGLYGQPYLLNSITITFVDSFSIAGSAGEIVIENGPKGININIHLKDFDAKSFQDTNTVIHEIIHGFHGVAVLQSSALEEGMTVAATDAVMEKMMKDGKLPAFSHLYLTVSDDQYKLWNQSLRVPENNTEFYSSPDVSKVYQLIGKAWYRLYEQDPDFFKKVNANYYPKVQKGKLPDDAMVLDAIRSSVKTVDGQSIDTYLASNRAFSPN